MRIINNPSLWPSSITTRIKTSLGIIISHLLNVYARTQVKVAGERVDMVIRHSGYFPSGFMVSLYVKGKENGHVQAYAPTGAMVLKWRSSLTSELDGYPIASEPHLWWQACPWRKSLSRKIALTRIKFYGRKLQVKAFQTAFGQMQGCADFMRLWRNFMPRQFSSMIFYYHLLKKPPFETLYNLALALPFQA